MRLSRWGALLLLCSCTSVKLVQRDNCWVKQTEKWPSGVEEQLGFCTRPTPAWAQDRAARLVQECMVQADYRWGNRALAAWSRGLPIPQEPDEKTAQSCMSQISAALGLEAENATLKARLAELSQDRESLRTLTEKDRAFLEQSHGEVVSALGEAAKKVPPAAIATATSSGTARSDSQPGATPAPSNTLVELNTTPAPAPLAQAPASKTFIPACNRKLPGGGKLTDGPTCPAPPVAAGP